MKPYEIIEHTADVGIRVNSATLKGLFENAAKGMFEIIAGADIDKIRGTGQEREIRVKKEVEGLEELLVDWMSEALYIFKKEHILFTDFRVLELNNNGILGKIQGKKIDSVNTSLQTEIKAVTFHNLKIEEHKNGFSCNIIFDV